MLSFPDIARWYMEKFFHLERRVMKAVKPIVERVAKVPLPDDDVFFSVEDLYKRLEGMRAILTDRTVSTIRLVCQPEKIVIEESRKAFTYLNLFGFPVDSVIINRVLPQEAGSGFLEEWCRIQSRHLETAENAFHDLKIFKARLFATEMVGMERLGRMGRDIFGDLDPSEIFVERDPMVVKKVKGGYNMIVSLPFEDKNSVDLWVKGEELILKTRYFQRNLLLPHSLASSTLENARFEKGRLIIRFSEGEHG